MFLALALVALAVALFVLLRPEEEPVPPLAVPPPTEEQLIEHFAPLYELRLQDRACDRRGEAFLPSPVELVIGGQPEIRLRAPGQPTIQGPTVFDLERAGPDAYLDFPGDPRSASCRYERDFQRLSQDLEPTVYARIAREPDKEGFAIQYWAFYYLNDWNNVHEGDWEMVQLVFEVDTLAEGRITGPAYTVYAQHGGGERADWDSKKLRKEGTRPIVFVSAGSHASYYNPRTYLGLGEAGSGLGCDVALPPHMRISPNVVMLREGSDDGEPRDAWLDYPGRWGQRLQGEFNGPTGPATKRAWREPLTWAEDARSGSTTLPAGDLLGLNAVHSFCGAVENGSQVLRVYMQYPRLVSGALLVVAGIVAVTGLVVLRDFARSPLVPRDTARFLDHRRSLGQMIRASIIIYLRHARLFLSISFVLIPANFILSFAHNWLIALPYVDRVLWLLNANLFSRLVLGLLVGGIATIGVYLFVVSATIAAVRMLDAGRPVSFGLAQRAALRRAPTVLIARLVTLSAIAALALSLVGFPLAIWLAVRWYFVEQAALLDGAWHWNAIRSSALAVSGQWFRACRLVLGFALFGMFAGPLAAFALLLGTGWNPALVNVLAGVFHTATLPFTAIGLCLAYRDLQVRKSERRARTTPVGTAVQPASE